MELEDELQQAKEDVANLRQLLEKSHEETDDAKRRFGNLDAKREEMESVTQRREQAERALHDELDGTTNQLRDVKELLAAKEAEVSGLTGEWE